MPTYRNVHPCQYITFAHERKSYNLGPGATLETEVLLDHIEWLRRIDIEPFYNHSDERMSFRGSAAGDIHEVPINYLEIHNVRINVCSGCVDVYINSLDNTPPHRVDQCNPISIDEDGRIDKLIFEFVQPSDVDLVLYRRKRYNRI